MGGTLLGVHIVALVHKVLQHTVLVRILLEHTLRVHNVLEHKVLVHIGVLTCFCTFSFICSGHGVHSSSATSPGGTC